MSDRNTRKKQANILLQISKAIAEAGAPAHRLESYMQVLLEKFGLKGYFFALPTAIMASIGESYGQKSYMIRTTPGDIDLATLQKLNAIINQLEADDITIDQALADIKVVVNDSSAYPMWLTILSFGVVSGGFSSLFLGSIYDIMGSALMGWITGFITLFSTRNSRVEQLLAPICATVVGFLSLLISHYTQLIDHFMVSLAGLIVLVPGLGITVAIRELSTGHLVSGSARMAGAVTTLFLLSFGLALGFLLAEALLGKVETHKLQSIPSWSSYIAMLITAMAFTVIFKSRVKDTGWIFLAIVMAFLGSTVFGLWIDQPFQSLASVMVISMAGNIYARITSNPAALMHIPGIILLVPGSIGFNSLSSMLSNNTVTGIQAAFDAVLIAVSISIGLLVGNLLVPPKKDL